MGEEMDNVEKTTWAVLGAILVGSIGLFFKDAWDDAQEQAEEAANPRVRWTDKNRWED
ncbi:hypothetical protein SRABI26_00358 [Arthrobacter sp. Bi26]|uniref:hypothetical protein n=1 Tax=Arthrobacter sp. Bi26 TaxID=2822350 RepID=UPI001DEDF135|nr:hypothetical protein [Arthrobacter sp. Bi26]CAH0136401.1 hypothetical protein SRABI26_00358 [Arthrobacter sp. Bi26]